MLTNAFLGKAKAPTKKELAAELGPAQALWDELLAQLAKLHIDVTEWNSYSRKAGWALKVKSRDRTVVYLSPSQGCFMASFALGEKAMQAARKTGLPDAVLKTLDEAKRYAEGSAVRIEVRSAKDLDVVTKLAQAKQG
jgi:Protein of unknown function (DUF3788)